MYSPASGPCGTRAAPAKKRNTSAIAGISSPVTAARGLPVLRDSSEAYSSPFASMWSAILSRSAPRSLGRSLRPTWEGLLGRRHRRLELRGARLAHRSNLAPGRRIQYRFAGTRPFLELSSDQQLGLHDVLLGIDVRVCCFVYLAIIPVVIRTAASGAHRARCRRRDRTRARYRRASLHRRARAAAASRCWPPTGTRRAR